MIDYNDIKQTIAENLPDNNRREITAAKLRDTLDGFVDKVQVTEAGLEGKVTSNETNIGNLSGEVSGLSGRVDTNEANVTNLTGRVDSLEQTVENLPGGGTVKVVDNPGFGGVGDASSARWVNAIGAVAGVGAVDYRNGALGFKIGKATVHPGYLNDDDSITDVEGYSYFEYEMSISTTDRPSVYIIVPAYGGSIVDSLPVGKQLYLMFYNKDGRRKTTHIYSSDFYHTDILPHEYVVPYGITKVRGSLVNGTFDPDGVYVVESTAPSGVLGSKNIKEAVLNQKLPISAVGRILNGSGNIEGIGTEAGDRLTIIRLLKNDELSVCTDHCTGAHLAIADGDSLEGAKTIIYELGYRGWIFYKADKDCYAFIGNGNNFKITHNDLFNDDLQYQLNALIKKIDPSFGKIELVDSGKGVYWDSDGGTNIVFKVPIIAGTTLNYTLNSPGTFTLGKVAYWYSGQPVATENIENRATFSENVLGIVGGTKSGYMLVTFRYSGEGNIPTETFNATYLSKNA